MPALPEGLYWSDGPDSYELDLDQLLEAVGAIRDEDPADDGAPPVSGDSGRQADSGLETREPGAGTSRNLTAAIADQLPAGPALARLLSGADESGLSDWDLPGVAASYRRVASWAQAGELAAVAQIAARTAARDERLTPTADGRPAELPPGAVDEVSLALTMSHVAASWWSGLALDLRWRLAATGAALAAGAIDVARARLISEATTPLSDELAQAVEARVLPAAGSQTTGQLRAALRRAVIVVDPRGADDRRRDAEQHARVRLYADESGTASLVGSNLPATLAAAGMARVTAMARALKATQGGRLDTLCAYVVLGLLAGTMPLIPPAPGAPPDPDAPPGPDTSPVHGRPGPGGRPGSDPPRGGQPARGRAARNGSAAGGPAHGPGASVPPHKDPVGPDDPDGSWRDAPIPADPGLPPDADRLNDPQPQPEADQDDDDGGRLAGAVGPAWPPLPFSITQRPPVFGQSPPGLAPGHWPRWDLGEVRDPDSGHPRPGFLDLTIGWDTLVGRSMSPADLSRIGPVTASQALPLAAVAGLHPGTTWRVILTDPGGVAIAVERVRRRSRSGAGSGSAAGAEPRARPAGADRGRSSPASGTPPPGVVGRVTVVLPLSTFDREDHSGGTEDGIEDGGIRAAIWRAAVRAARRVHQAAAADASSPGPCAHAGGTAAYRPTRLIREYVEARDQTCRQPTCRQPARRTDLDHTRPWHLDGPTCSCNLGPRCRTHHKIKQLPGWTLTQPESGTFRLTTPAGRTYLTRPDAYPM